MNYLILSSEAEARDISREFYRLSRPLHIRDPDDVTEFFSHHVVHPVTGEVALAVPDTDMPIHADVDSAALASVTDGRTNAVDKAAMRQNVANKRNQRATMTEIFPPSINGDIKDQAFMDAQGWFPEKGVTPRAFDLRNI